MGPAGPTLDSIDSLDGTPCRGGAGILDVSYDPSGSIELTCLVAASPTPEPTDSPTPGPTAEPPGATWVRQFGTAAVDEAIAVAVGATGAVIVAGTTFGVLPGQAGNAGSSDAFVRAYRSDGTEAWTHQFGTHLFDEASSVAVDGAGNVFVAGRVGRVAFVRSYGPDGAERWAHEFGWPDSTGSDAAMATGIEVDALGNAYVSGALPATGAFVRSFAGDGSERWTRTFGTARADDLAVSAQGDVVVIGRDYLVAFGQDGSERWTRPLASDAFQATEEVAVDRGGNAYVVGWTYRVVGRDVEAIVRSFDATGADRWTRIFGTSDLDRATSVTIDPSGDVLVAGETWGSLSGSERDLRNPAFVRVYGPDGTEGQTSQFSSSAEGIAADTAGEVVVAGAVRDVLPGQVSAGGTDAVVRRGDLEATPWVTITADPKAIRFGDPLPAFTASYDGLKDGDTPDDLDGTLAFATGATAASPVGWYDIVPSGLTSQKYGVEFTLGTLTIARDTLRIEPATMEVAIGSTTTVTIVQRSELLTSGAQARLSFDSSLLQIVSVTRGAPYADAAFFLGASPADIAAANETGMTQSMAAAFIPPDAVAAGEAAFLVIELRAVACGTVHLGLPLGPQGVVLLDGRPSTYGKGVPVRPIEGDVTIACPD